MQQRWLASIWTVMAGACAQNLGFSLLPGGERAPSARIDGAIAYDAASRRILMFGGDDGNARNDLWAYSLVTRRWEELTPAGAPPPARFGHTLIFDEANRQLVVFGGQAGGFFNDTWAYSVEANRWTQLAANQSGPSRRYGHSAIYDAARRRMVVSHGFTNAGRFDDTWALDLTANSWREISPPSGRPLRRCLHHAVYDRANDRMLLFGGCASGAGPCPLGDLWAFDLARGQWREITGSRGPAPREHYGFAFDDMGQRAIVFSGEGPGVGNDAWAFDARTNTWQALTVMNAPRARSRHQGAAITDRGTVAFFGGSVNGAGTSNELWMLGPAFSPGGPRFEAAGVGNAFSGVAGGVAPGEIVSIYGADLGPLEPLVFGFDPVTRMLPVSGPGLSVTFNGVAAPLYFASAGQLNVQAPYEIAAAQEAEVVVRVNARASEAVHLPVRSARPGLFPGIWNEDGTLNSRENPARSGSVIVLYATGHGATNPPSRTGAAAEGAYPAPAAPAALMVAGRPAPILFAGQAPGTAGVLQVNARLPESAAGENAVTLEVGDARSPAIRVFVR